MKDDLINAFKSLGSGECKITRKMMFFELNSVQIDIMINDEKHMDFATCFYSYNDLSSLFIKKICSTKNLMLTTSGLYFDLKDNENKFVSKILVTDSFNEVLELFDFDVNIFRSGFKSIDDIFDFIVSSKYFNSGKFNKNLFNKVDLLSYSSRPVFKSIVDRLNSNEVLPARYDNDFLLNSFHMLPQFKKRIIDREIIEKNRLVSKELFNGGIVSKITGLSGENLGKLMQSIRLHSKDCSSEFEYFIDIGPDKINISRI